MIENASRPFFFGAPTKKLFGYYDAPQSTQKRNCSVVICYPFGHEYIAAHRALRQLAGRLARAGFPVLRFDYYGCGDSNGDCDEGSFAHWLEDVTAAIAEIRARSDAKALCLIGLRLGGALSVFAGVQRGDIAGMVLWNPVVDGGAYLNAIAALHRETLRHLDAQLQPYITTATPTEIMGFPLPDGLRRELESIDLIAVARKAADDLLLIETQAGGQGQRLLERLRQLGSRGQYLYLPSPGLELADLNKLLVPSQVLHEIVTWISERYV